MTVIQGYTQSVLLPQLRSLGLSKRQREIVVEDVLRRLESLLFHWSDQAFRRTILTLGTEEATFWEPQTANLEIRSLVAELRPETGHEKCLLIVKTMHQCLD